MNKYTYLEWCFENIPDFMSKLDDEDKENLKKLAHPIEYINKKYKVNFKDLDFDKLEPILKSEGFLNGFNGDWSDEDGCIHYRINTIYGWRYGSVSSMWRGAPSHNMSLEMYEHMKEKSENYLGKYNNLIK